MRCAHGIGRFAWTIRLMCEWRACLPVSYAMLDLALRARCAPPAAYTHTFALLMTMTRRSATHAHGHTRLRVRERDAFAMCCRRYAFCHSVFERTLGATNAERSAADDGEHW